jgi:hypothetical protein
MPNGFAEERDAVYRVSRFWGIIWTSGDAAYYVGLLGSIVGPLLVLLVNVLRIQRGLEPRQSLLGGIGWAVFLLLVCFPLGLGLRHLLQGWARRRTGVQPR